MKHVCPSCSEIIYGFGYPCHKLMDAVTTSFFEGNFMMYRQGESPISQEITPALAYLEDLGILLSTEMSLTDIIIIPNLDYAYFDDWNAELCWCKILNHIESLEDNDEECNDC